MEFYTVIDTGAFVWDRNKLEEDDRRYYALSALLIDFLNVMKVEKPTIFLRGELRDQIFCEFPWEFQGIPNFWELSRSVAAFLSNADITQFDASVIDDTTSQPTIIYEYYSDAVKSEIGYLIREMHSNTSNIKYFTFCPIWNEKEQLVTKRGETEKLYETVVHCTNELQTFIEGLKPKFVHSQKHNRLIRKVDIERGFRLIDGKRVYPFSANYSEIPNHAQSLLELSITHELEPGKAFYFDYDNNTFVCFMKTGGRIYHGFDIPAEDLLEPIRTAIMEKFDEQNQG